MSAVDAVSDADIAGTVVEAIDSFDAMGLTEPLLRGIYAYGFEKPSAIQQRAIKPLMSGQDTIDRQLLALPRFESASASLVYCQLQQHLNQI